MKIICLRGISGSGKSTLANQLATEAISSGLTAEICCADDFMMVDGKYEWRQEKLGWAHRCCQEQARLACEKKTDLVLISNTNLPARDRKPYIGLAEQYGYGFELLMVGDFTEEFAKLCAARNTHAVPEGHLLKVAARFRGTEGLTR